MNMEESLNESTVSVREERPMGALAHALLARIPHYMVIGVVDDGFLPGLVQELAYAGRRVYSMLYGTERILSAEKIMYDLEDTGPGSTGAIDAVVVRCAGFNATGALFPRSQREAEFLMKLRRRSVLSTESILLGICGHSGFMDGGPARQCRLGNAAWILSPDGIEIMKGAALENAVVPVQLLKGMVAGLDRRGVRTLKVRMAGCRPMARMLLEAAIRDRAGKRSAAEPAVRHYLVAAVLAELEWLCSGICVGRFAMPHAFFKHRRDVWRMQDNCSGLDAEAVLAWLRRIAHRPQAPEYIGRLEFAIATEAEDNRSQGLPGGPMESAWNRTKDGGADARKYT